MASDPTPRNLMAELKASLVAAKPTPKRDLTWGADCDGCEERMNAGRAQLAAKDIASGEPLLCGSCRDEAKLAAVTAERDALRAELQQAILADENEVEAHELTRDALDAAVADRDTLLKAIADLQQNAGIDHVRKRQALYNRANTISDRVTAERRTQ